MTWLSTETVAPGGLVRTVILRRTHPVDANRTRLSGNNLTADEDDVSSIKAHVEVGERIIEPVTSLKEILPWIRGHHERWDGSGYPDGLRGEEIPLEARILAVADAFDAMTSQRTYNKPLSFEEALVQLRGASGEQFDPRVVTSFGASMRQSLNRTLDPESELAQT